jgi:hypothetical protein
MCLSEEETMNLKVLTITWNPDKDITTVKFNDEFIVADSIFHWDILEDAIIILQDAYKMSLERVGDTYRGVPKKINSNLEAKFE